MNESFKDMFEQQMRDDPDRIEREKKEKKNSKPKKEEDFVDWLIRNDLDTVGYLIELIIRRGEKSFAEQMFDIDRMPLSGIGLQDGIEEVELIALLAQYEDETPEWMPNMIPPIPRGKTREDLYKIFIREPKLGSFFGKTSDMNTVYPRGSASNKTTQDIHRLKHLTNKLEKDVMALLDQIRYEKPEILSTQHEPYSFDAIEEAAAYIEGIDGGQPLRIVSGAVNKKLLGALSIPKLSPLLRYIRSTPYYILIQGDAVVSVGVIFRDDAVLQCKNSLIVLQDKGLQVSPEITSYLEKLLQYLALIQK